MKAFVINKDSWHYWLLTKYSLEPSPYHTDKMNICSYTRRLFGAFIITLFMVVAIGFVSSVTIAGLIGWVLVLLGGAPNSFMSAGMIVTGCAALFASGVGVHKLYKKYRNNQVDVEPGFIKTAYTSFHDKFCIPIEYKDE